MSIHSQDIEKKLNYDRITDLQNYRFTELQKDRQGKSSIAPLFQSGAIKNLLLLNHEAQSFYILCVAIISGTQHRLDWNSGFHGNR